jgi:hypothetical protein
MKQPTPHLPAIINFLDREVTWVKLRNTANAESSVVGNSPLFARIEDFALKIDALAQ